MKILMAARSDSEAKPGGDTIQLLKTAKYLGRLGVDVQVSFGLPSLISDWDLVHLFNLESPEATLAQLRFFKDRGFKVALSPIYWEQKESAFEEAVWLDRRWKALRRMAGAERSYGLWSWNWRRRGLETPRRRLQAEILDRADLLLPNSSAELRLLAHDFARPELERKAKVAVNGYDPEDFDPSLGDAERVRDQYGLDDFVLSIGHMTPGKNQLRLLQALKSSATPVVLIGADRSYGVYAAACRRAARERKGPTFFLPWMQQKELVHWYAAARVHALLGIFETTGLVSLEAAAMGCAVVTTDRAPHREYFGDQAHACDPRDAEAIRRAVHAALQAGPRPGLKDRMVGGFTWLNAAKQTRAAYRQLLSTYAPAARRELERENGAPPPPGN